MNPNDTIVEFITKDYTNITTNLYNCYFKSYAGMMIRDECLISEAITQITKPIQQQALLIIIWILLLKPLFERLLKSYYFEIDQEQDKSKARKFWQKTIGEMHDTLDYITWFFIIFYVGYTIMFKVMIWIQ